MYYTRDMFENKTTQEIYTIFGEKETRGTTSKAIRELSSLGFTRSQISKMLGIRYQHVRNVQLQILKRVPSQEEKVNENKDQMEFKF